MKLQDYKLIFIAIGLVGVLIMSSPAIAEIVLLPTGEQFSELYLLDPGHMAENYPYNITVGENYSVYFGVNNHLSTSAYYTLYVKLKNQTDLYPNATTATPSSLPRLYENRFIIQDGKRWESPVTFSIANATFSGNQSNLETLTINNSVFNVNKHADWDTNATAFGYTLLFELWVYDVHTGSVEYNNRYVYLQLNMTQIAGIGAKP